MPRVEEDGLNSVAQVRSDLAELCRQMRDATASAQYYYFRTQYDEILDILASTSPLPQSASKSQKRKRAYRRTRARDKYGIEVAPEPGGFDDPRSAEQKRREKKERSKAAQRKRLVSEFQRMRVSGERFPSEIEGPEVCTYFVHQGDLICRRYSYKRALARLLVETGGKRCFFSVEEAQANSVGGFFYACPYGRHWHRTTKGFFLESFTT